ncbi:MAG: hypothetical protein WA160_16215 [Pseudobdellovibrio sp.]
MIASSEYLKLQFWLDFISSQNNILYPAGSAIWHEGIELLNSLKVETFLKPIHLRTKEEILGFNLIEVMMKSNSIFQRDNFIATGDLQLKQVSKLYKSIQQKAEASEIKYNFSSDVDGDFTPWDNEIILGTKFYTCYKGHTRIPFYSFNHDNAHLTLFKEYYSNINISNEQLNELFILIEWFCISLDLILAYDLLKSGSYSCLTELNTIANINSDSRNSVFFQKCGNISQINIFANEFRAAFLANQKNDLVENLISYEVLLKHTSYSQETLVYRCREITTSVSSKKAKDLIEFMKKEPFTEIIKNLTGINYDN